MEWVVDFVMDFAMVKVVIKGVEEQFISKQPDLQSLFCLFVMITGCKDSDNMMLVVKFVVVFVVNFAMVKVVLKAVEEQFISQQPDHQSVFRFYVVITGWNDNDFVIGWCRRHHQMIE